MTEGIADLYDYAALRQRTEATMFVTSVDEPSVVLGGSQGVAVLDPRCLDSIRLRRRKGGGGLVLLRPGDVGVDWWIPPDR